MHAKVTFEVSAIETKKISMINILSYINLSQVGNILYLDKTMHTGGYYLDPPPSLI